MSPGPGEASDEDHACLRAIDDPMIRCARIEAGPRRKSVPWRERELSELWPLNAARSSETTYVLNVWGVGYRLVASI